MPESQNDISNVRPFPDVREETATDEDEINLIDYFKVIWKRKSLILLGSVLPAFIVGLILFFSPRNYKVTYIYDVKGQSAYDVKDQSAYDVKGQSAYDVKDQSAYDVKGQSAYDVKGQGGYDVGNWSLNEKNYTMFLEMFYSAENIDKIATKLQGNGLNKYAERINTGGLKNFVDFEVSPSYIDLSKTKITNAAELEQIRRLEAQLLNMTIIGRPKKDISKISLVIRDNLENVISVYMVQNQLSSSAREYRGKMASIEENKFNQELASKTNKAILAKLESIKTKTSDTRQTNIALQFDISGKTEYLPVEYQIQATESKTIQLEEQLVANEKKYDYYKDLLALNEKLFAKLKGKMSSYYTIQQFRLFLIDLIDNCQNKELKSYLNSYIKRIENRISASAPVTGKPSISAVAKGTAKKSGIVLAISLMISIFAAFLLEGLKKSQAQTS